MRESEAPARRGALRAPAGGSARQRTISAPPALASWRTQAAGCDRRESPEWGRPYGVRGLRAPGIYKVALRAYLRATGDGGPYRARQTRAADCDRRESPEWGRPYGCGGRGRQVAAPTGCGGRGRQIAAPTGAAFKVSLIFNLSSFIFYLLSFIFYLLSFILFFILFSEVTS